MSASLIKAKKVKRAAADYTPRLSLLREIIPVRLFDYNFKALRSVAAVGNHYIDTRV